MIAVSLLLFATGGSVACGGGEEGSVTTASRALVRANSGAAPKRAQPPRQTSGAVAGYQLYLDGSQSMAGFAGCLSNPSEFDSALDHLAVDFGITTVWRFGAEASGPSFELFEMDKRVHCQAFYSRVQNPDAALFKRVLDDASNSVALYVTDGVQSDLAANQSPSVKVLNQWLDAGFPLAILALKSRFSGRGWSEAKKVWVGHWEVASRPFYVYVFARNDLQMDAALARISPTVKSVGHVLRFGDSLVRCTIEGVPIARKVLDREPLWMLLRLGTTKLLEEKAVAIAQQNCVVSGESPLRAIQFGVVRADYGRWNGRSFVYPLTLVAGTRFTGDSNAVVQEGFRAVLRAKVVDDPSTRFGFYWLTVTPGAIELKREVAALSTDSDADMTSAATTYRIAWVLEQLLRTQVARSIAPASVGLTVTFR